MLRSFRVLLLNDPLDRKAAEAAARSTSQFESKCADAEERAMEMEAAHAVGPDR
jgi:hypothetical protein